MLKVKQGATLVEYALILTFVFLVALVGYQQFGATWLVLVQKLTNALGNALS